jgi:hypothetical protein
MLERRRGAPWTDVVLLKDALARGMSFAEVAGFLGRTEDEGGKKHRASESPL